MSRARVVNRRTRLIILFFIFCKYVVTGRRGDDTDLYIIYALELYLYNIIMYLRCSHWAEFNGL